MIYEEEWKVRISEVNAKLNMKFTGILEAFQEAATKQFEDIGLGIKDRDEDSLAVIMLNTRVNVKKYPRWDDNITVKTWCNELNKIYCYRNFEMLNENGELIATGMNKLVMMDLKNRRVKRIDDKIREEIPLQEKFLYDNNVPDIEIPNGIGEESIQVIRNKDIDINGHVNNVAFVEIALNTLSREEYKELEKKNLEVFYKKECKNKDKMKATLYKKEAEFVIVLKGIDEDITYCVIRIY